MSSDVSVALLRMEGANCEDEMAAAFQAVGARTEHVHLNQLDPDRVPADVVRSLMDYDVVALPGGFSAGDYVRAGAIFAARLKAVAGDQLDAFHEARRPILGVCNGFQILVEMGLLPGANGHTVNAALSTNDSDRFECRPVFLEHTRGNCQLTSQVADNARVCYPNAHAEGKLLLGTGVSVDQLESEGQIVFRYVTPDGDEPAYPWDPNGAAGHVAGLTDPTGTVLGLMPHPERAFHGWQTPYWTRAPDPRAAAEAPGDGRALFESVVAYARKNE